MKKIRDFKCDKCEHKFESFVDDDTEWPSCINCGGDSFKRLSSPKCFQNTTGKSPSVSKKIMKILDKLEYERIVSFAKDRNHDGFFIVTEMCDWYFDASISKDELLKLAEELKQLAES